MKINPITNIASTALSVAKKATDIAKKSDNLNLADVGLKVCEGVIDGFNCYSGNSIITSGIDEKGKVAFALNNRPELHYHNTFNFYISAVDSANEANVERMIHRIISSVPSK